MPIKVGDLLSALSSLNEVPDLLESLRRKLYLSSTSWGLRGKLFGLHHFCIPSGTAPVSRIERASNRAINCVIFATVRKSFSPPETAAYFFRVSLSLAYDNHRATVMQIDQDLYAALYVLGFNFLDGDLVSGEIAEIKGDMTIKLVHRPRRGVEIRRRVAG